MSSECLVMVDAIGRIVFVDKKDSLSEFLTGDSGQVSGEPFFDVFNISFDKYKQMTNNISNPDAISTGTVELININQVPVDVTYKSIVQLDSNNSLLGYDILLNIPTEAVEEVVVDEEQIQFEILCEFITNLMAELHQLLSRIGGKYLSNHMTLIVNNIIQLNKWDISFVEGKLDVTPHASIGTLQALITRSIQLSVKAIGKPITQNTISKIQSKLSTDDLKIVSRLDIDSLVNL